MNKMVDSDALIFNLLSFDFIMQKAWASITDAGEKLRDGAVQFGQSVSKTVKTTVDEISEKKD